MVKCAELEISVTHETKLKRTKILLGIEDTLGKALYIEGGEKFMLSFLNAQ